MGSACLTDSSGNIKEYIEYTPWGEEWYKPISDIEYLPNYQFTGKEQDATGLYYFGARYYDPQVSLWMSTDPILDKYLEAGGKGGSGVFNSKNISLYTYCHQSPIGALDPDGNDVILLNDTTAAIGNQHVAVLVGNDKNGWYYYSKDGTDATNRSAYFFTYNDFKNEKSVSERFDRGYRVETSEKQDSKMQKYGDSNFNKPYSIVKNDKSSVGPSKSENCADLTYGIVGAGNADAGEGDHQLNITAPKNPLVGATSPVDQFEKFMNTNKGEFLQPNVDGSGN